MGTDNHAASVSFHAASGCRAGKVIDMNDITLRFAQPERDARRILDVYAPFIEDTAVTFEIDVPEEAAFEQRVLEIARAFPYLLLEIDGEVAGYAYAHRQAERAAYAWNAELTIYLSEKWQHRGLGRPLYALLMRLLEMQGYVNFYALITASNADSLAMHERMGFVRVGFYPQTGYKFGQWHDVVILWRRAHDEKPGPIRTIGGLRLADVEREIEAAREEMQRLLQ